MNNVIFSKALSLVWKLLAIYSTYILLRGHNEPGGGFIGGLLLALAIIIRGYITKSKRLENKLISIFPQALGFILIGFMMVILLPSFLGDEVLKGIWTSFWIPIAGKFSSILVFDLAVYLLVAASAVYTHRALNLSISGEAS